MGKPLVAQEAALEKIFAPSYDADLVLVEANCLRSHGKLNIATRGQALTFTPEAV